MSAKITIVLLRLRTGVRNATISITPSLSKTNILCGILVLRGTIHVVFHQEARAAGLDVEAEDIIRRQRCR